MFGLLLFTAIVGCSIAYGLIKWIDYMVKRTSDQENKDMKQIY